jgi:hypothetical protein
MRGIYGGAPKETHKCVETDGCETNACETDACGSMDPELCPVPSSMVTSCFPNC